MLRRLVHMSDEYKCPKIPPPPPPPPPPLLQTWILNSFVHVQCIINVSILWLYISFKNKYASIQTISVGFRDNIEGFFKRTLRVSDNMVSANTIYNGHNGLSIPYPYVYAQQILTAGMAKKSDEYCKKKNQLD